MISELQIHHFFSGIFQRDKQGFPKHTKCCSHFQRYCRPLLTLKAGCIGNNGKKWPLDPGTSSQSEGYSSKWLNWLVCREPMDKRSCIRRYLCGSSSYLYYCRHRCRDPINFQVFIADYELIITITSSIRKHVLSSHQHKIHGILLSWHQTKNSKIFITLD